MVKFGLYPEGYNEFYPNSSVAEHAGHISKFWRAIDSANSQMVEVGHIKNIVLGILKGNGLI